MTDCSTVPAARLIDRKGVAARMGISKSTVERLARKGELPRPLKLLRSVRWDANELEAWLSSRTEAGGLMTRDEWERSFKVATA